MPKDVDNWARIDSARGSVGKREMGANGGKNRKLNYQERVAVIWIEKVKRWVPAH